MNFHEGLCEILYRKKQRKGLSQSREMVSLDPELSHLLRGKMDQFQSIK